MLRWLLREYGSSGQTFDEYERVVLTVRTARDLRRFAGAIVCFLRQLSGADDCFNPGDVRFSGGVGEYTVMPDLTKTWRQDVGAKTVNEVFDPDGGHLLFRCVGVVTIFKGDRLGIGIDGKYA